MRKADLRYVGHFMKNSMELFPHSERQILPVRRFHTIRSELLSLLLTYRRTGARKVTVFLRDFWDSLPGKANGALLL